MVMIENIHHGEYLERRRPSANSTSRRSTTSRASMPAASKEGVFRPGLDPVELHWQISALCFFNVSNRATFSKIFGRDFGAPDAARALRAQRGRDGAALRRARRQAAGD